MDDRLNRPLTRFLRWFFKHLYTTFAWAYDFVAWSTSMGQWRTWQKAALQDLPSGCLLELGSGPGHLLLDLNRGARLAFGLDPSPQMARMAARRLRRSDRPARVLRASAEALPFPAGNFSAILATFPSDYILEAQVHAEAWRVLAEGGSLIIVGLARITGRSLPDRVARWLYQVTGQSADLDPRWAEPFESQGFQVQIQVVTQPRAQVIRIVAHKPRVG